MTAQVRNWRWVCGAIALLLATVAYAADGPGRSSKARNSNSDARTVEMFAAIEKGDIAVKVIPKDSAQCTVLVENKTDKPLTVKLPDAFAAVPVLAQALGGAGVGRSSRGSSNSNRQSGNQGTGGGMGGMGGGMFNIAPEKTGKFVVPTVCLEHGKASPRASIPYEIKTIESFTTKAGVRELCQMVGTGKVDQRAAQAAAWHLNNNMTWQELAAKRIRHRDGRSEPYFSQAEIQVGIQIAATAVRTAAEQKTESPSETPASGKSISESSK